MLLFNIDQAGWRRAVRYRYFLGRGAATYSAESGSRLFRIESRRGLRGYEYEDETTNINTIWTDGRASEIRSALIAPIRAFIFLILIALKDLVKPGQT